MFYFYASVGGEDIMCSQYASDDIETASPFDSVLWIYGKPVSTGERLASSLCTFRKSLDWHPTWWLDWSAVRTDGVMLVTFESYATVVPLNQLVLQLVQLLLANSITTDVISVSLFMEMTLHLWVLMPTLTSMRRNSLSTLSSTSVVGSARGVPGPIRFAS